MEADRNAKLADRCQQLDDAVRQAADWVRDNEGLVRGERDGLLAELRRSGRFFRRCRTAATRKMCVGVFGPSQAGKSYLISALARNADGRLMAMFGEDQHDFVGEINPEGGKESTGLVTRFTMTRPTSLPPGFPVQVRLLSEMDLVKIFANTYYADCEHQDEPDAKAITELLDSLEKTAPDVQGRATLDDFEELKEYLDKNFKAKPRVQELGRSFWPRTLSLGPRLGLADRLRLYSLLWDRIEPFDKALGILAGALERLGHPDTAYCPLDALIPRDKSIIDVAMLAGLGEDGDGGDAIAVATAAGAQAVLPRAVVTALTTELTIVMREKPDDYFDHTDLLDFPGYRSRYKIFDIRRELQGPGMLKEFFLRGKVAYLFQRYCAERELTSMLLCIGPSNQEVQDLPGVINEWIVSTHGKTPEHRKDKAVSLYFVLTKSDMEFEEKAGQSQVKYRWDIRLQASLLDFFGKQYEWPNDWDGRHKFNNLFLLRNPNYRFDAVLNYGPDKRESGVRPEKEAFVAELREAFLQSPAVKEHFQDPAESWNALMQLNDGGIRLLRERLRPACNPQLKRQQIETSLLERKEILLTRLKAFWKSDNREEKRQQQMALSQHLARIFATLIQGQRFGEFLCWLCVKDHDLHAMYYEARREMEQAAASSETTASPASVVGVTVDAVDLLADIFGDAPAPAGDAPAPDGNAPPPAPPRDEAAAFAARIEAFWCNRLREVSDDPKLQRYFGLPQKQFGDFVGELILGAARLNLRGEMETAMRKAAAYADIDMERVIWKQASLAAGCINAFVDWLGYDPRRNDAQKRSVAVGGRRVTVFDPPAAVEGFPKLSEEMGVLERQWYRDWLMALVACILANVDFEGGITIDVEQNRLLGEIITAIAPQVEGAR
ncbi:MAG: virulence factor SrfC family protein [Solidesulfovibrio sp. DCME]|uniref:virulence factor SrfC family protein n=1 Tax=Solidesulfovibrio sp. DCME TaxID=3447380 RepID=UPI003D114D76